MARTSFRDGTNSSFFPCLPDPLLSAKSISRSFMSLNQHTEEQILLRFHDDECQESDVNFKRNLVVKAVQLFAVNEGNMLSSESIVSLALCLNKAV